MLLADRRHMAVDCSFFTLLIIFLQFTLKYFCKVVSVL